MRERPDDKRVAKTIRNIHATFEQMMCEMDYRDITVKELCERALVNKKTFYRYYETMDFLLAEFQENMMTDRVLSRHDGESPANPERSVLLAFIAESTLAIYRQWVAGGKTLPAERVADIAAKLVCHGALA